MSTELDTPCWKGYGELDYVWIITVPMIGALLVSVVALEPLDTSELCTFPDQLLLSDQHHSNSDHETSTKFELARNHKVQVRDLLIVLDYCHPPQSSVLPDYHQ